MGLTINYKGLQEMYGSPKKKKKKENEQNVQQSMNKLKKRLKEQVKKLSREELEKRYVDLLFKYYKDKKDSRISGVIGSMISKAKKQKENDTETISERKKQYYQDLEHPKWISKRALILERDNHQCRICGSTMNLQVHHTKYCGKRPWEYPNSTLITLCKECHQKVHQDTNNELNPYKKEA